MIIEMAATTAAFDIPKLRDRVKAIAATYKESAKEDSEGDSALEESSIYQSIRGILRNLVLNVQASDPNYWRRAGLRMVDPATFTTCLDEVKYGLGCLQPLNGVRSSRCLQPATEVAGSRCPDPRRLWRECLRRRDGAKCGGAL